MAFKRKTSDFAKIMKKRDAEYQNRKTNKTAITTPEEKPMKSTGKFLKWLKLFKEEFGKKGMEWLLWECEWQRRTINYEAFSQAYYDIYSNIFEALSDLKNYRRKNQKALAFLDNLVDDSDQFYFLTFLASATFKRYGATDRLPNYLTFGNT